MTDIGEILRGMGIEIGPECPCRPVWREWTAIGPTEKEIVSGEAGMKDPRADPVAKTGGVETLEDVGKGIREMRGATGGGTRGRREGEIAVRVRGQGGRGIGEGGGRGKTGGRDTGN